jgi:lactate dehydrogenase-like 2-hydroxyacid dehydrogenase
LVFLTATLKNTTASLASGFPTACVFVNDRLDAPVLAQLARGGTKFVALRCTGFNNVDLGTAEAHGITIVRVPAYSPYAVAEFTVGILLALDRQVCRGWLRDALKRGKVSGVAMDVYEQESDLFFEDLSSEVVTDDVFQRLLTFPNVIVTGHQAFFTRETLAAIAQIPLQNLADLEEAPRTPRD